jgi:hypothetical protein
MQMLGICITTAARLERIDLTYAQTISDDSASGLRGRVWNPPFARPDPP